MKMNSTAILLLSTFQNLLNNYSAEQSRKISIRVSQHLLLVSLDNLFCSGTTGCRVETTGAGGARKKKSKSQKTLLRSSR